LEKRDTDQLVMKLTVLETINTLYPKRDWLHIYTVGSLTAKNGNVGARNYYKLFSFYLSLGQHATHFDGETEAMNTALMQIFGRTGSFTKAIIFSDSITATELRKKSDALPHKRVTEIYSYIKLLKGLQKHIKFMWISYHCDVADNEQADHLANKGTKIKHLHIN
jgi:ribonuclease HI